MAALTRATLATFAKAVRHPLPWTAVAVLLGVLVLLPVNDRSPIDSPVVEDGGMSTLAPLPARHVKLTSITQATIALLMGDVTPIIQRLEPSSAPIDDRRPLLAALRI